MSGAVYYGYGKRVFAETEGRSSTEDEEVWSEDGGLREGKEEK